MAGRCSQPTRESDLRTIQKEAFKKKASMMEKGEKKRSRKMHGHSGGTEQREKRKANAGMKIAGSSPERHIQDKYEVIRQAFRGKKKKELYGPNAPSVGRSLRVRSGEGKTPVEEWEEKARENGFQKIEACPLKPCRTAPITTQDQSELGDI